MPRLSILGIVLLGALALPPIGAGAGGPAVVTILEGNATLFRGTSKLAASECVRVQPTDLIETGKESFVRLEFEDGTRCTRCRGGSSSRSTRHNMLRQQHSPRRCSMRPTWPGSCSPASMPEPGRCSSNRDGLASLTAARMRRR